MKCENGSRSVSAMRNARARSRAASISGRAAASAAGSCGASSSPSMRAKRGCPGSTAPPSVSRSSTQNASGWGRIGRTVAAGARRAAAHQKAPRASPVWPQQPATPRDTYACIRMSRPRPAPVLRGVRTRPPMCAAAPPTGHECVKSLRYWSRVGSVGPRSCGRAPRSG